MLSSGRSDGSFTKTHHWHRRQHPVGIGLAWGETIWFGNPEFIADHFNNLSLSPKGGDSSIVFVGMTHNGMPSLHTIFEEYASEDDSTSSEGGSSGFPISWGCNVVNV
jgi:hypothetical protein